MIQSLKLTVYRGIKAGAGFSLAANSAWRRNRLVILCYHGVALSDECKWNSALYISAERLRSRLEALRRLRCNILALDDGVERLFSGTLPPRSVVITFDDGYFDFYRMAMPVLREYQVPATVYVSTYYVAFARAVFDPMLSYLLWKGSGHTLEWPEMLADPVLLTAENRMVVRSRIWKAVSEAGYSAREKDCLLRELADRLGIDYEEICSRRILHLMNTDELRETAALGFDLQLHTHRHRMPPETDLFVREIEDNRRTLEIARGEEGAFRHFCYPSGVHYADSGRVLRECGVLSATTCDPGVASRRSDPRYLPRYLDSMNIPDVVFEAWVSGAAGFLPRRGSRHVG
jgi:peptidoglycan/xylan/chitin deacetylase (PgdA/CDA1 family)